MDILQEYLVRLRLMTKVQCTYILGNDTKPLNTVNVNQPIKIILGNPKLFKNESFIKHWVPVLGINCPM